MLSDNFGHRVPGINRNMRCIEILTHALRQLPERD